MKYRHRSNLEYTLLFSFVLLFFLIITTFFLSFHSLEREREKFSFFLFLLFLIFLTRNRRILSLSLSRGKRKTKRANLSFLFSTCILLLLFHFDITHGRVCHLLLVSFISTRSSLLLSRTTSLAKVLQLHSLILLLQIG